MKALSLTQPWASLVALGAKQIETRSWSTAHRGELAIHAAKGFPRWARQLCSASPFYEPLAGAGLIPDAGHRLPLGAIVAVVDVRDVLPTDEIMRLWLSHRVGTVWNWHEQREHEFGDYADGRYGWRFGRVRRLMEPVSCCGHLGLWTVPPEIEAAFRYVEKE